MAKTQRRKRAIPKSFTTRTVQTRKKRKSAKKKRAFEFTWCTKCNRKYTKGGPHDCEPITESEVIAKMNEDFADAYEKIREFATALGEQRIYCSENAIMFAKRVCYLFVRPKKSFMEVCFFTPEVKFEKSVGQLHQTSKTRIAHTYRVTHADQVEEPLTDWIREAFETTPAKN